jgi:GDP-L-fucose synthase
MWLNVGWGADVSIAELANAVAKTVGYEGRMRFDTSKPDGTPRKLLEVSRLAALGWKASIPLADGLADTYRWFLENLDQLRT